MGEVTGHSRLEQLARELASGEISRRSALRRLGGAGAAALVPSFLLADDALAKCPKSRQCGSKCCPSGAKCKHGKCKCKSGLRKCGKKCVDRATDPKNCGSCGHACAAGETCANGACAGGTPQAACGNNVAEGTEQCDGSDLKGATCQSLGFISGTLACGPNCTYNTSGCVASACNTPSDCPGTDTVCRTRTCSAGVCGVNFAPTTTLCGTGQACDGAGNCVTVPPVCGNGIVEPGEQCDDGNTLSGDGCSSTCQVEAGYQCTGQPSVCTPIPAVCGNGIVEPGEQCDDGNLVSGDGCSSTCQVEPGYQCVGQPSVCVTSCGDGIVAGAEQCDDGNLVSGDGCSSTCQVEPGWQCSGSRSVCVPIT
jgi:large repetitive protein